MTPEQFSAGEEAIIAAHKAEMAPYYRRLDAMSRLFRSLVIDRRRPIFAPRYTRTV